MGSCMRASFASPLSPRPSGQDGAGPPETPEVCANFNSVAALGVATLAMAKLQKSSSFAWRGETDKFSLLNAIDHAAVRAFASGRVEKENASTSSVRVYFLDGSYVTC